MIKGISFSVQLKFDIACIDFAYTMFRQALYLRNKTPLLKSIFHTKFQLIIAQ